MEELSLLLSVKNTFVHVGMPSAASRQIVRRCASAPPSPKNNVAAHYSSSAASDSCETCVSCSEGAAGDRAKPTGSDGRDGTIETGSTVAFTPPASPEMKPLSMPEPPPMPVPTATHYRTPLKSLKSSARSFQPVAPHVPPPPPQTLEMTAPMLFMQVVTAAASAMMSFTKDDVQLSSFEDHQGWVVQWWFTREARLLGEDGEHAREVCALGKAALLRAAENSTNIYVMGYQAKPFQDKSGGFEATLGLMQDEDKACWCMYTTGACDRGRRCRWQHPKCLKRLLVIHAKV